MRTYAVIARSCLEALFRLRGATKSQATAIKIIFSSTSYDLKKCKKLKESAPYPAESNDIDVIIADLERDLKDMRSKYGKKLCKEKLNIFEIARLGGWLHYYRTSYFILSQYVHSNYATTIKERSKLDRKCPDSAVLISLCKGAETIAHYHNHPDLEDISSEAKPILEQEIRTDLPR